MTLGAGVSENPRSGGFLPDLMAGYKDNRHNPFNINNLEPDANKGFAHKLGEGLGTAVRFADSPIGRGVMTGAIVSASGGSPLEALAYGGTSALGNQTLRNENQLYRDALKQQGLDTKDIGGFITGDMYKNASTGMYRSQSLNVRQNIANMTDKRQKAIAIARGYKDGIFGEDEAQRLLEENGMTVQDLEMSNSSYNSKVLGLGNLGVARMNAGTAAGGLGLRNAEFQFEKDTFGAVTPSKMPANSATNLSSTLQGIDQMATLDKKINSLPSRLTTPGMAQLSALNPYDTSAQSFQQYVNTYKQVIGKGLEGGVLRKEDEIKYQKIIPKVGDTPEVLRNKSQQLKGLLVDKYNTDLGSLEKAGYYTQGFSPYQSSPKKTQSGIAVGTVQRNKNTGATRVWDGTKWQNK
jgi:hypothetical protein